MHLYREVAPHPLLAGHVACLWTSHMAPGPHAAPVRRRILPDNCIDILWQDRAPRGFVAGMMSRSHQIETAQPVQTVAVRFLPGAARAFVDVPLHALQDQHVSLDDLWPRADAEALAAALWERELDDAGRLAVLERALLDRALLDRLRATRPSAGELLVRAAVGRLETSHGLLRVETLADALGVSRQRLGTLFRERVGLSAKTFAMVCRFRRASAGLERAGGDVDWTMLAGECGYYDQSHLIHDFRLFADATPEDFARRRR